MAGPPARSAPRSPASRREPGGGGRRAAPGLRPTRHDAVTGRCASLSGVAGRAGRPRPRAGSSRFRRPNPSPAGWRRSGARHLWDGMLTPGHFVGAVRADEQGPGHPGPSQRLDDPLPHVAHLGHGLDDGVGPVVDEAAGRGGQRPEPPGPDLGAQAVGHDLFDLVGLVEDDDVVGREHHAPAGQVGPVQMGVDHHHVGLGGAAPGLLGEAVPPRGAAEGARDTRERWSRPWPMPGRAGSKSSSARSPVSGVLPPASSRRNLLGRGARRPRSSTPAPRSRRVVGVRRVGRRHVRVSCSPPTAHLGARCMHR